MAEPTYMELDWRKGVRREQLIERIDNFMTAFDSSGKMKVHLVNSTAKKLVRHEASGNHMILQKQVVNVKKYRQGNGASASTTEKYLGRMRVVAEEISKMVDAGNQCTPRNIWYKLRDGDFTIAQIDQLFKDLALTIMVHPYNLGLAPEAGQSFVRIPNGIDLEIQEVKNIFEYTRTGKLHKRTCRGGDCIAIVPMIKSIKIVEVDTMVRAVVGTEHRSIKEKLERHFDQPGFEGIFLVLTGGFPDAACREFLNLLSKCNTLTGHPFLWESDCDAHSLQMYSVIKFGSANLAYASPSMVCPQLVFGGMTMEKLEGFFRNWPARFVADKLKQQQLSSNEQKSILEAKSKFAEEKLHHLKTMPSSRADKSDRQRISGLRKAKTLSLAGEEGALAQLDALEAGGAKLSFFRLDELEQHGVAFFVAEQVAAVRGDNYNHPAMFGDWSQARAAWNAASQQAPNRASPILAEAAEEQPAARWDLAMMD